MHMQAKILQWGNSLGIRLSGRLKDLTHFKVGTEVNIDIREDGLFIKKATDKKILPFSEKELLVDLDASSQISLLTNPNNKEWHD